MSTSTAAILALAMSGSFAFAQESGEGAGQGGDAGQGEATTFDIERSPEGAAYEDFNRTFDQWGTYDEWDADEDDMLTRDEFNRGVFGMYDRDANDRLDDDEIVGMQNDRFFDGGGEHD